MMIMSGENLVSISGIVDVGIIVISHFDNPAKLDALKFLKTVLKQEIKALVPVTAFIGAYHIMVNYLGVSRKSAKDALTETLSTRSPAFYQDVGIDDAIESLDMASIYNVESWDGYLIALARKFNCNIIYSIDRKLSRVEEITVVNPIPEDKMKEYYEFIKKITIRNNFS